MILRRQLAVLQRRQPRNDGPLTTIDGPGRMVAVTGRSPAPSPPRPASVLEAVLERFIYVNDDTLDTLHRAVGARRPCGRHDDLLPAS